MAGDTYLTVREAAERLNYKTPQSVYDKVRTGEIPSEKIGHFRRIKLSDIQPLIEERRKLATQ